MIPFDSFADAVAALEEEDLDGLAGVRQAMNKVAAGHPAYKVLAEPFMVIPQAVGVSIKHADGARFVGAFVREKKATGFIRQSLDNSGHTNVAIPS